MKRTIEKLSQQRKEKQESLANELEGLKKESQELSSSDTFVRLQHLVSRMQELVSKQDVSPDIFRQQVSNTLKECLRPLPASSKPTSP